MLFEIGLEIGTEDRTIAWVLGHPGCYAYGADSREAVKNLPPAIQAYIDWIAQHEAHAWLAGGEIEIQVEATWEVFCIDKSFNRVEDGYEVNAWFLHDWKPLEKEEIERGLQLLSWSRTDLLRTIANLSQEQLEKRYPGERWNISGILRHVGAADWWYMDRLGLAFPRREVPAEAMARLEKVRLYQEAVLPSLEGSNKVIGIDGEFWSPRKLLRRAVWHERDHTQHIRKLLGL